MPRREIALRGVLVLGGLALGLVLVALASRLLDRRRLPEYDLEAPPGAASYFRWDPDLGYGPTPGVRVRSRRWHGGDLLYDVRYTIDENGLRVTPGSGAGGPAVVVFGGSFTFGEGVEDDETLPARLASWMHGRSEIVNAGFHGYGPHQMLRSLETGRLDPRLPDGVEHVVYQGIDGHVARVAGRTTWDVEGPAYGGRDGKLEFLGPFRSPASALALRVLNRFGPTRSLVQWSLRPDQEEADEDLEVFVEVVARSAELARERWGARFTVVWWDDPDDPVARRLEERGLDVLRVSDTLERGKRRRYLLPVDGHPNARAHQLLARDVTRHIWRARRAERDRGERDPESPVR